MIIIIPMVVGAQLVKVSEGLFFTRVGSTNAPLISPIVICDYTRSDEQYSISDIKTYCQNFASDLLTTGMISDLGEPIVYSLDYSMTYSHNGVAYGNSLKTKFNAKIKNAPSALVTILKIQQYTSQQNLELLKTAVDSIIDPQVAFPTGGFVIKDLDGAIVTRKFTITSTPFTSDERRINNTLELNGANYEDVVLRLKIGLNLNKKETLKAQMKRFLEPLGYVVNFAGAGTTSLGQGSGLTSIDFETFKPVIDKFYAPATINNMLSEVGLDNNVLTNIKDNSILFLPTAPGNPPNSAVLQTLCFDNSIPNVKTKLISYFNLSNYATVDLESELFDAQLFTAIKIYDDSGNVDLFANLAQISGDIVKGILAYRFYLLAYIIQDSRFKTSIIITATNNWLMNVTKLDTLLESKIYTAALNK